MAVRSRKKSLNVISAETPVYFRRSGRFSRRVLLSTLPPLRKRSLGNLGLQRENSNPESPAGPHCCCCCCSSIPLFLYHTRIIITERDRVTLRLASTETERTVLSSVVSTIPLRPTYIPFSSPEESKKSPRPYGYNKSVGNMSLLRTTSAVTRRTLGSSAPLRPWPTAPFNPSSPSVPSSALALSSSSSAVPTRSHSSFSSRSSTYSKTTTTTSSSGSTPLSRIASSSLRSNRNNSFIRTPYLEMTRTMATQSKIPVKNPVVELDGDEVG